MAVKFNVSVKDAAEKVGKVEEVEVLIREAAAAGSKRAASGVMWGMVMGEWAREVSTNWGSNASHAQGIGNVGKARVWSDLKLRGEALGRLMWNEWDGGGASKGGEGLKIEGASEEYKGRRWAEMDVCELKARRECFRSRASRVNPDNPRAVKPDRAEYELMRGYVERLGVLIKG